MNEAFKQWSSDTCLKFEEMSPSDTRTNTYLGIHMGTWCLSYVGSFNDKHTDVSMYAACGVSNTRLIHGVIFTTADISINIHYYLTEYFSFFYPIFFTVIQIFFSRYPTAYCINKIRLFTRIFGINSLNSLHLKILLLQEKQLNGLVAISLQPTTLPFKSR